jgi:uncharacterized protein
VNSARRHDPARDQEALIRALADRAVYAHHPDTVEHIQTHISHVFLAGCYAYKLKKAVALPFLDFTTPARRQHFCVEEIRLNRRLAPGVYLDVLPLVWTSDGRVQLEGEGEIADYVVRMRRLPADRMLADLVRRDAVEPEVLVALATILATFHERAPTGPEVAACAAPDRLHAAWNENLETMTPFLGCLLTAHEHAELAAFGARFIATHELLLRSRQAGGCIREGHGDIHAGNVCVLEDRSAGAAGNPPLPTPGIYIFDRIEFSRAFRCNDVASEIAFLAIDLECSGRPDLARRFVDAYVHASGDRNVVVLLPFYACYRACVRAKVESLTSTEPEVEDADRRAAATRAREHVVTALAHARGRNQATTVPRAAEVRP